MAIYGYDRYRQRPRGMMYRYDPYTGCFCPVYGIYGGYGDRYGGYPYGGYESGGYGDRYGGYPYGGYESGGYPYSGFGYESGPYGYSGEGATPGYDESGAAY